jgi:hypothetical protein
LTAPLTHRLLVSSGTTGTRSAIIAHRLSLHHPFGATIVS